MNKPSHLLDQPYFEDFIDKFYASRILGENSQIAMKKTYVYAYILSLILKPHRKGDLSRGEFNQVKKHELIEFVEDNILQVESDFIHECLHIFVSRPEKYPLPQKIELIDVVAEKMGSNIRYSKDRKLDDLVTLFHLRDEYFKKQQRQQGFAK